MWLTEREMVTYRNRFKEYMDDLERVCMTSKIDYVTWTTEEAFENMFLGLLSRGSALAGK